MPLRSFRPLDTLWNAPAVLLTLTMVFWSGNMLLGKAMAHHIPPVAMAQLRWSLAFVLLLPFALSAFRADWPVVRRHIRYIAFLGLLGISGYNTLVYVGLQTTSAVNAALLGAGFPMVIAALGFVLYRDRLSAKQVAGVLTACAGAAIILSNGDLSVFTQFRFVPGDLWVIAAQIAYGLYTVILRSGPAIHPLSLLLVTVFFGQLFLMPLTVAEAMAGQSVPWSLTTGAVILYLAVFPSLLSFMFFNRAVNLIGSNRTAPYFNLVAVFSVVGAMLVLGEQLSPFDAGGWVLIVSGIWLAQQVRRRRAPGAAPTAPR